MLVRSLRAVVAAGMLHVAGSAWGQGPATVQSFALEPVDATTWKLLFTDPGSGATGYEILYSSDLTTGSFELVPASLAEIFPGGWEATVSGLPDDRAFFRVRLLGVSGEIFAYFDPLEIEEVPEGGTAQVTVYFSAPYSGPLTYTWFGTAPIVEPTGTVQANGQSP